MADLNSLADGVSQRISSLADRAKSLAGGIALLSCVSGAVAYMVGVLVFEGGWRWAWAAIGLVLCVIPGLAAFLAYRRLRTATKTVAETSADLRTIASDKRIRVALTDLGKLNGGDDKSAPLVQLGRELLDLKTVVFEHKSELAHLRQSMIAVTGFPGLMALGTVGAFMLLAFSGLAVLLKALL